MIKHSRVILSALRIGVGLLIAVAITLQLIASIQQGRNIANFFSFFTIQSNILAAIALLTVGIGALLKKKATAQFALIRGAATLYMTITGIVFALLLSGLEQQLQVTLPWVNIVLHYITPAVMILDWLVFPPSFRFSFKQTVYWLAFPAFYLFYSLIRGAIVHWYPYPFLDPIQTGWPTVLVMSIFITIGTVGLSWVLALRTRIGKSIAA
jgi:hypothetical protein